MTDSTNLWTGLLNDELYERTNEVGVFLTKMAADLGEATDGAVRAAYHKQSDEDLAGALFPIFQEAQKLQETVSVTHLQQDSHIDANNLYKSHTYVFAIQNETYSFQLFLLVVPPVFPIAMTVDEGVYRDTAHQLNSCGTVDDEKFSVEITNQEGLVECFDILLKSKKLRYLVNSLCKEQGQSYLYDESTEKAFR